MPSRSTSRRALLKAGFGVAAAATGGVVLGPVVVAFLDPIGRTTVTRGAGQTDCGKLVQLRVGQPRKVDIVGGGTDAWDRYAPRPVGAVWLVRRDTTRVDAFSAVCPHLGCAVGFDLARGVFACPCHTSAFSLDDGRRLAGPAPRGLDPLPVEVHDGEVLVTYQQFIQGIPSRREA